MQMCMRGRSVFRWRQTVRTVSISNARDIANMDSGKLHWSLYHIFLPIIVWTMQVTSQDQEDICLTQVVSIVDLPAARDVQSGQGILC